MCAAPTTPEGRVALGNEGRIWRISYTEYLAAVGTPKITFTSGDDTPDATTYPSALEICKFLTENFDSKAGATNFEKQTHSRGKLQFSGQEYMEWTVRTFDWLDPNFLTYMPGISVAESSTEILLRPASKRGVASDVLLAVFPQDSNQFYQVIYEPEGTGEISNSISADGTTLTMVELKINGRKKSSRTKGDRVGLICKKW